MPLSSPDLWIREKKTDRRRETFFSPGGLAVSRYEISAGKPLAGKRLLFFSDLHIRSAPTRSFLPGGAGAGRGGKKGGSAPFLRWEGTAEPLRNLLFEGMEIVRPDILLFGGDLLAESAWMDDAFRLLKALPCPLKLAVPGNWDKRRRRWMPQSVWQDAYRDAGFHYLRNEAFPCGDILFYGTDDYKIGTPVYRGEFRTRGAENKFRCLLSHNPDSIPEAFRPEELHDIDLILCGHTHGGQIRLPFFGAVKTSSRYGKKLEYGSYRLRGGKTQMILSSGIGCTFIPLRICCPPEIVWIQFI